MADRRVIFHWLLVFAALCALGPLAGWLVHPLTDARGSSAATILTASPAGAGLLPALAALGLCALPGLLAARLVSFNAGLGISGLAFAWMTWRIGTVDDIIRSAQSPAPLTVLAIEAAALGAFAMLLVAVMMVLSGQDRAEDHAAPATGFARRLAACLSQTLRGSHAFVGLAVAAVVAGVTAWVIAVEPLKGQTVAAACAAGLFAGAAARVAEHRTHTLTLVLAFILVSIAGPLAGTYLAKDPVQALYSGGFFPLANILPLDWLAGMLMGLPMGTAWAASMVEAAAPSTA